LSRKISPQPAQPVVRSLVAELRAGGGRERRRLPDDPRGQKETRATRSPKRAFSGEVAIKRRSTSRPDCCTKLAAAGQRRDSTGGTTRQSQEDHGTVRRGLEDQSLLFLRRFRSLREMRGSRNAHRCEALAKTRSNSDVHGLRRIWRVSAVPRQGNFGTVGGLSLPETRFSPIARRPTTKWSLGSLVDGSRRRSTLGVTQVRGCRRRMRLPAGTGGYEPWSSARGGYAPPRCTTAILPP